MKKYKKNYILIFVLSLILLYYLFSQSIKRNTLNKENLENSSPCNESEHSAKFKLGPTASNKALNSFISNIENIIDLISSSKSYSYIPNSKLDPSKAACKGNDAEECKKKVTKVTKLNDIKICLNVIKDKLVKFRGSKDAGPDPPKEKRDNESVDDPNGSSHKLSIMRFGGDENENTRSSSWDNVNDNVKVSDDKISKSIRKIIEQKDNEDNENSEEAILELNDMVKKIKEIEDIRKQIIPRWVFLSKKLNRTTDEN